MTADQDNLLVEVEDGVAVLTLNRPQRRNALDATLRQALHSTIAELDQRDDVDVLILTGADPAFCAGVDLKSRPAPRADEGPPWPLTRSTPLIGAVNGPAMTGGLELALECDVLLASERAWFADTHAAVGVVPFWGLTLRLPEAVGRRRAALMSLTGKPLGAEEAARLGMVSRVVPHDELLAHARAVGADVRSVDQRAARTVMAQYRAVAEAQPADAWATERDLAVAFLADVDLHGQDRLSAGRGRARQT